MISKFVREQHRYTKDELCSIFECTDDIVNKYIKRLRAYGILKQTKKTTQQMELSDLLEEEIGDTGEYYYVFVFVGIIVVSNCVLKCYPKYLSKDSTPTNELGRILKVLEKYNNHKEQIIKLIDTGHESVSLNRLALLLIVLNDYYDSGVYNNTQEIREINGSGEILWDRTINETYALISQGRPYYMQLQTRRRVNDEYDYFKRLHEYVLTKASSELAEAGLLDLFSMTAVELSDECRDDFGDDDYILYRIERELNIQFNTRKQQVLKYLYVYIHEHTVLLDINSISVYGTNSFAMIWEDVCSEILDNQLRLPIGSLPLSPIASTNKIIDYSLESQLDANKDLGESIKSSNKYSATDTLLDIIERPMWTRTGMVADGTLKPDIIRIYQKDSQPYFAIFDAKYYVPTLEAGRKPANVPGIEDITKQYLYQLAYTDFLHDYGFINEREYRVRNCFLLPTDGDDVVDKGEVVLEMLSELGLENIKVRLLPARRAYEHYLLGTKMDIGEILI